MWVWKANLELASTAAAKATAADESSLFIIKTMLSEVLANQTKILELLQHKDIGA